MPSFRRPKVTMGFALDLTDREERIAKRLAKLLVDDEAGWERTAQWLDGRASDEGIDLFANYDNPLSWARSVVDRLRQHSTPRLHGALNNYETAEESRRYIAASSGEAAEAKRH